MPRPRLGLAVAGCVLLLAPLLHAESPPPIPSPTEAPAEWPRTPAEPIVPLPTCLMPSPDGPTQPVASSLALYPPAMFGDLLLLEPVRVSPAGVLPRPSAPVAFRSSFKIAEDETPRPLDRVFLTGNYYGDSDRTLFAPRGGQANVYREMLAFAKTFLGGNAAVGVRVPYFQLTGLPGLGETHVGDVSFLFKYAFINDRATGNLASAGIVVTVPTGPSLPLAGQSSVNPTFIQPWLGSIWNWKKLFVQNFLSVAISSDARDATLFFKDVSVGYWLYRTTDASRWLTAIVPDAELHLNTPLDHHGQNSLPIGLPDTLDFTGGCYFFLRQAILGVGVGAPLMGPTPYEYLVTTNLNFRF